MTVFRYFLKNAYKLKWYLIIYLGVFLIISLINTNYQQSNQQKRFQALKGRLAISQTGDSQQAQALAKYLMETTDFKQTVNTIKQGKELVFLNQIDAAVYLADDFDEQLAVGGQPVSVLYDDSNHQGYLIERQVNQYLLFLQATVKDGRYDSEVVDKLLAEEVPVKLMASPQVIAENNHNTWFRYFYNFAGYLVMALFISIIGIAMSDFQEEQVRARMAVSAVKNTLMQLQFLLGQLVLAAMIVGLIIGVGQLINKKGASGVPTLIYSLNLIVFSLSILGLTFLINQLTTNRQIKNGLSIVTSLGVSFISGIMVPQVYLGKGVLQLAHAFPAYYFVKVNDWQSISSKAGDFQLILPELGIQLLFGLAFVVTGLYISKIKRGREMVS